MELEKKIQKDVSDTVRALFAAGIDQVSPELTNISIKLEYYPIIIDGDNGFIPTGTAEAPKGITKFKGQEVVIFDKPDEKCYFISKDELKKLMLSNLSDDKNVRTFKRDIGWDFKTMGLVFNREELKELLELDEITCFSQ